MDDACITNYSLGGRAVPGRDRDPYAALGIQPSATTEQAARAAKAIALAIHPDKCDHPKATEAMKSLFSARDQITQTSQAQPHYQHDDRYTRAEAKRQRQRQNRRRNQND